MYGVSLRGLFEGDVQSAMLGRNTDRGQEDPGLPSVLNIEDFWSLGGKYKVDISVSDSWPSLQYVRISNLV